MKNKIKYLCYLVLISVFVACSNALEEVPLSQSSPENAFNSEANAIAAIAGVYGSLQLEGVYGKSQGWITTDENYAGPKVSLDGFQSYTFTADNTDVLLPIWRDHYLGINRANLAISNIPKIDMDVTERNSLVAEAKFIKSLLYFNLIRYFGDVPYKATETASLNNLDIPRTPVADIYEKIIKDLEYGVENLKVKAPGLAGHATQDAAKTLLASIYLTRGSMAKRDGTGDGLADFISAMDYAEDVMDAPNGYKLCDYFPDAFTVQNKNNNEIIFDVQFKSPGLGEGNSIASNMGLPSNVKNTDNLLAGGSTNAIRANPIHQFYYDEPADSVRRQWTDARIYIDVANKKFVRLNYADTKYNVSAAKFRRYPVHDSSFNLKIGDNEYDVNWPVFRYAEVLLIYAEASNEVNGPTQKAIDALNQLRSRARNVNIGGVHRDVLPRSLTLQRSAGLADLTLGNPLVSTKEAFMEYIFYERSRELSAECKRWFDLVRWGKLKSTLQGIRVKMIAMQQRLSVNYPVEAPLVTVPPFASGKWNTYWTQKITEWNLVTSNVQDYHELFPIPNAEILANPAIGANNDGY
jgi:hypothetical protein